MVRQLMAACLFLLFLSTSSPVFADETDELFFAIEQNGIECGYARVLITDTVLDGRPVIHLQDNLKVLVSALGAKIDASYRFEYWIDPQSGQYIYHTSDIDEGVTKSRATMTVVGDSIHIASFPENDTMVIFIPPGTVLQSTRLYPRVVADLADASRDSAAYKIFSEPDAAINDIVFSRVGTETLELAGKSYNALALNMMNRTLGMQGQLWLDLETGMVLKGDFSFRKIYLTDPGIVDRIKAADMNENILSKVGVVISDPWAISYMKVRAILQPGGTWITADDLNIGGQSFTGTVQDNLIDGIFEISHPRYDGAGAPPYPPDFSGDENLKEYLEPGSMIESDDSALAATARDIAAGSQDSWEAFKRLSQWVSDEISYDIPGGATALNTFKTRLGECGSHSNLLAAFSRAVGIPCRVVFGCMYMPSQGGAFGQHAWNEVYMGDAGWIPIDATAEEIDYVDCAHIRLGERISKAVMFNPQEMEILDYRVGEGAYGSASAPSSAQQYEPYLGKYQAGQGVLTVLVQNGSLAVDIPGKMIFELKDPDENGKWFFKLTGAASVSFEKDSLDNVTTMIIESQQKFPRKSDDTLAVPADTPDEYRPYLGTYTVPMQKLDFTIFLQDGGLAMDIAGQSVLPLVAREEPDAWECAVGSGTILIVAFDTDDSGRASGMNYSELTICRKIEEDDGK